MTKTNQTAESLTSNKNELYVRSRVLEETDTRGNRIRTLCRISMEWSPDLSEEDHRRMEHVYLDALDNARNILSF